MKTNKTRLLQKLALLTVAVITITLSTGCANTMGTGEKGHRGGPATALKGTRRHIYVTSDCVGTTFTLTTRRGTLSCVNIEGHYLVDTKDDWGPIIVEARFADGQTQKAMVGWTLNGVGLTTFAGANGLILAAGGIAGIPGLIGDGLSRAGYDLDQAHVYFAHQKTLVLETPQTGRIAAPPVAAPPYCPPQQVWAPAPSCPPPGTPGLTAEQLRPVPQRQVPTTFIFNGGMGAGAGGGAGAGYSSNLGRRIEIGGVEVTPDANPQLRQTREKVLEVNSSEPIVIRGK